MQVFRWVRTSLQLGLEKPRAFNSYGTLVLIRAFFRYSKLEVAETSLNPAIELRGIVWMLSNYIAIVFSEFAFSMRRSFSSSHLICSVVPLGT